MISRFLKIASTQIATAAALAVLISSAQASVILNPGTISVNSTAPVGVVSSSLSSIQVTNGDVTGLKIFGNAQFTSEPIGSPAGYNVSITDAGSATGTFQGSSIPLSWDFTLAESPNGGESALSWTLTYTINPFSVCTSGNSRFTTCALGAAPQTFQTSGSGFGQFTGTGSIGSLLGTTAFAWSVDLDIQWQPSGLNSAYTLDVTIPNNSIDFPAAVPEPTTSALMGAGLAALGFIRHFRRK